MIPAPHYHDYLWYFREFLGITWKNYHEIVVIIAIAIYYDSASDWFTVINIVSVVSVVIKHDQVYVSIIYCDINCNQVLYIVLIVTVIPS